MGRRRRQGAPNYFTSCLGSLRLGGTFRLAALELLEAGAQQIARLQIRRRVYLNVGAAARRDEGEAGRHELVSVIIRARGHWQAAYPSAAAERALGRDD